MENEQQLNGTTEITATKYDLEERLLQFAVAVIGISDRRNSVTARRRTNNQSSARM